MIYTFPPAPSAAVPIEGSEALFPVRRIWCVGRNYAEHALEMGGDPDREPPFFFGKPADAIVPTGGELPYPLATQDLHHEVELAVGLRSGGSGLSVEQAGAAVFGCAVALDMTRRDLQSEAKRLARPWDMGKAFDRSCPIGAFRPCPGAPPTKGAIRLTINGEVRQSGDLHALIWPIADTLAALSQLVELAAGDVILTGTPAGVGPVRRGDQLRAECDAAPALEVRYA
ncbi:fumarylacetoacetate hydrolase family protein [Phenylobacterium sp.]|uniref:fumarylacetoacetate hydrolase family protein n=1 Tax=Phenylobacterium sp. TaxID=1871053 RepID=UPI002FCA1C4D